MIGITALLQQGQSNAWLFIPSAIALRALYGLEPGHSKTMMAAFIVAVRGTWQQAMLLGGCATLLHTAVVWIVGGTGGACISDTPGGHASEPYFHKASGVISMHAFMFMALMSRAMPMRPHMPGKLSDALPNAK